MSLMHSTKNAFYYLLATVIFILLKWYYTTADNEMLFYLLQPTNAIVCLVTGTAATLTDGGYYNATLSILIDKSCSGFNFMLICFAVMVYVAIPRLQKPILKIFALPVLLLLSGVLTVFVNAARILSSVYISEIFPASKSIQWMHEAQGAFIYLSFLVIFYLIAQYTATKLSQPYEKPA